MCDPLGMSMNVLLNSAGPVWRDPEASDGDLPSRSDQDNMSRQPSCSTLSRTTTSWSLCATGSAPETCTKMGTLPASWYSPVSSGERTRTEGRLPRDPAAASQIVIAAQQPNSRSLAISCPKREMLSSTPRGVGGQFHI